MSGYLIDTSVLSTFAPGKAAPSSAFEQWLTQVGRKQEWFLPVIAVAEVQKGVAKLRRAGADARAERLETWLASILDDYRGRIIPITESIARRCGDMEDAALAKGRHPGLPDILIASTAQECGFTVVTANTRHFSTLGVPFTNPFDPLPASP